MKGARLRSNAGHHLGQNRQALGIRCMPLLATLSLPCDYLEHSRRIPIHRKNFDIDFLYDVEL